jgi:hypothetical protein
MNGHDAGNLMSRHLQTLLQARYTVLAIKSTEEFRIEAAIRRVAFSLQDEESGAPYTVRYWSCTKGVREFNDKGQEVDVAPDLTDPFEVLHWIGETEERMLVVLRDFHPYLKDGWDGVQKIRRRLRELVRTLKRLKGPVARAIVLLSPVLEIPVELEGEIHVVKWPLPSQADLRYAVDERIKIIRDPELRNAAHAVDRGRIVRALVGLTMDQAQNAISRSLVERRTLDPRLLAEEQKLAVGDDGILEWLEPLPEGLGALGGHDRFKTFAIERQSAFSPEAREYGLDPQKGVFAFGPPGVGKTYACRALAGEWGFRAYRFSVASLFGQYVGQTEERLRIAKQKLLVLAPVVVLIDEIDKALGTGDRDGGTSERLKGELLTWLQEPTDLECPVYRLCTANNVEVLAETSPELMRDGRWDERFFFDLPTYDERATIVDIHVKRRHRETPRRNFEPIDAKRVAVATPLFSPAELEAVVSAAMFRGFRERRPTTTEDLLAVAGDKTPLAKTAEHRIKSLRKWAKGRAVFTSSAADEDTAEYASPV